MCGGMWGGGFDFRKNGLIVYANDALANPMYETVEPALRVDGIGGRAGIHWQRHDWASS